LPPGWRPAGAGQIGPWGLDLKLHLQQPVRVSQNHLARLVKLGQCFCIATLVVQHLTQHRVVTDGIDPAGLRGADAAA
jgi:hypothetical protein